jgi:hypothetical protein
MRGGSAHRAHQPIAQALPVSGCRNLSGPCCAPSSKEADPVKREQLIKAALREHNEQVHYIPLHRQMIPWAMKQNVQVVHRPDNWLEWRWITIK